MNNTLFVKISGWVLLVAGIWVIAWTATTSYGMFTGSDPFPQLFEMPEESKITTQPTTLEDQMGQIIREQLGDMIPSDMIALMLNMAAWSVLATLLIFVGTQIASVGVKLLK